MRKSGLGRIARKYLGPRSSGAIPIAQSGFGWGNGRPGARASMTTLSNEGCAQHEAAKNANSSPTPRVKRASLIEFLFSRFSPDLYGKISSFASEPLAES